VKVHIVYSVCIANHGRSVHEEINSIVDAAFSNLQKSADLDSEDSESRRRRQADVSSSYPSANEHNSRRSHERGLHEEEKRGSANVDNTQQHQLDMRLKGDAADDETSWKQWREQRRQMNLPTRPVHETAEPFQQGTADDSVTFHGTESVEDTGSLHETSDRGFSAKSEDRPDSFDVASDEKETQSFFMRESSSAVDSSHEEHGGHEEHGVSQDHPKETDIPESTAVEITANGDSVDDESFRNVTDEQLLEPEDSDNVVTSDMAASSVQSDDKEEERAGKETFHEDGDREADVVHEMAEALHESSSDHDSDKVQAAWTSGTDFLDEASAADDVESQVPVTVTEDDQTVAEHDITADNSDPTFQSEEHSEFGSESNFIDEELSLSTDEGMSDIPPPLDNGNVDVVPDDGNTGWTFSAFSNIFSAIDAIIDMVSYKMLFMAALRSICGHYIFILWLLLSSFFPRLMSAVTGWMPIILPHMVWP